MRGDLQAGSLFKSQFAGAGAYCGGPTTCMMQAAQLVTLYLNLARYFYPGDAMLAQSLPSKDVCLSVGLSVTRGYCI